MSRIEADVCVVERNSAKTLPRCLASIRRSLPHSRIIVLDNGSTDESVAIAKGFSDIVSVEAGYVGRVRYKAAEIASTDWIIFVDSDVYLHEDWPDNIGPYLMESKVGMVTAVPDYPCLVPIYKEYWDYRFWLHGATAFSNTAVRRDLMLSCTELLDNIHMTEDWVVRKHIENLGFKAVTVKKPLLYHDKDMLKGHIGGYYRWGQSYRLKYPLREALYLGYLSYIRYQGIDWLNFSRTRKLSLTLLFLLSLVGIMGFWGILRAPSRSSS